MKHRYRVILARDVLRVSPIDGQSVRAVETCEAVIEFPGPPPKQEEGDIYGHWQMTSRIDKSRHDARGGSEGDSDATS